MLPQLVKKNEYKREKRRDLPSTMMFAQEPVERNGTLLALIDKSIRDPLIFRQHGKTSGTVKRIQYKAIAVKDHGR